MTQRPIIVDASPPSKIRRPKPAHAIATEPKAGRIVYAPKRKRPWLGPMWKPANDD